MLNYANTVWGIWYSQKLFDDERLAGRPRPGTSSWRCCETIKKSGKMAPFTYAGKHPFYIYEAILTLAAKIGGKDVLKNIDNLEDGAWKAEPVKQAATAFAEIGAKYLMQGTAGLDHVQTQTAQNKGQVAMLPCGSWLENEQKDTTPADFGYAMFPLPDFSRLRRPAVRHPARPARRGVHRRRPSRPTRGRAWSTCGRCCPRRAAGKFSELVCTLSVVKGAAEGRKLKPGAEERHGRAHRGRRQHRLLPLPQWYAEMHDEVAAATGQLMSGAG